MVVNFWKPGDGASIEAAVTLLEVAGPAFDRDSWVFVPRLRAIFSMLRPMSNEVPSAAKINEKIKIQMKNANEK